MATGCVLDKKEDFAEVTRGKKVVVTADFDAHKKATVEGTPLSDDIYPNYRWWRKGFYEVPSAYEGILTDFVNAYRRQEGKGHEKAFSAAKRALGVDKKIELYKIEFK